jgi:putative acetyltransferase
MPVIEIVRTNSNNKDFTHLVSMLDSYLAILDGDDHAFYHQFNKTDKLDHVLVAYEFNEPVGCGAIRPYDLLTMEIKRMYTIPEKRGKGIAAAILTELEIWAGELLFQKCVLETGKRQPEAIALYNKSGYKIIPNYGQYAGMDNSICFEKIIPLNLK